MGRRTDVVNANAGETVVGVMPEELLKKWLEFDNLMQDLWAVYSRYKKKSKRADALRTLFWQSVDETWEQCETHESRGKELGIRVNDKGEYVVVEFPPKPTDGPTSLGQLLSGLGGGGGGIVGLVNIGGGGGQ